MLSVNVKSDTLSVVCFEQEETHDYTFVVTVSTTCSTCSIVQSRLISGINAINDTLVMDINQQDCIVEST